MSKYHVIHGSVVVGSTNKDGEPERKTYEVGQTFDMSDEEAKPLLEAGTIAKGSKAQEGEAPPVTNPIDVGDNSSADADAQRQRAAEGAPEGSQDPKAAAKDYRSSASQKR